MRQQAALAELSRSSDHNRFATTVCGRLGTAIRAAFDVKPVISGHCAPRGRNSRQVRSWSEACRVCRRCGRGKVEIEWLASWTLSAWCRSERRGRNACGVRQVVGQGSVRLVGNQQVMGEATKWLGDKPCITRIEKSRHEPHCDRFLVVKFIGNDGSFPVDALSHCRIRVTSKTSVVGLRADEQDEVSPIDLIEHPPGPALRGSSFDVAIDHRLESVAPEAFGKAKHPFAMRIAIMTVRNENSGVFRRHRRRVG